jgi:riboflavin synthase
MFTGIITSIGTIESSEQQGDLRIKIASDLKPDSLGIGESVACNGACLTVISKGLLASGKSYFTASLSQESLSCTVPGQWEKGRAVNLERALKIGDALDGHMVSGHVDGLATIRAITQTGDSYTVEIEAPENLLRFIAEKGSVTLDGISLTVNQVQARRFWVNIIPHTWQNTTFCERAAGDRLNIEIDLIARYVARMLESRGQ